LRREIDKPAALRRARVNPESYAGELIGGLHDAIFQCSLKLDSDFKGYYSVEYVTFAMYLRKRYRFAPEVVDSVSAQFSRGKKIIYFQPGYCFLENEYGLEFLAKLFDTKEAT